MKTMNFEIEVKAPLKDLDAFVRKLREEGAQLLEEMVFEDNLLFDTPDRELYRKGQALRLRKRGNRSWITFKGRRIKDDRFKIREEVETEVAGFEEMALILEKLGFKKSFRYQKFTAKYLLEGTLISVDRTPIGNYVEIEGDRERVLRVAKRLGLEEQEFIKKDYIALTREKGLKEMVF